MNTTTTSTAAGPDSSEPADEARVRTRLVAAGVVFAVAVVLHNADHLRRGADEVQPDVFWLGTAAILAEVALVVLICQRHRLAPIGAAVAGFALAAGYVTVHFTPERSWLSDPLFAEPGLDGWSVTAASFEVAAAVALGFAGLAAVRVLGAFQAAPGGSARQRTAREALLHPVAVVFTLTQAATVAISVAQL